jgi:hypothetical protein
VEVEDVFFSLISLALVPDIANTSFFRNKFLVIVAQIHGKYSRINPLNKREAIPNEKIPYNPKVKVRKALIAAGMQPIVVLVRLKGQSIFHQGGI